MFSPGGWSMMARQTLDVEPSFTSARMIWFFFSEAGKNWACSIALAFCWTPPSFEGCKSCEEARIKNDSTIKVAWEGKDA